MDSLYSLLIISLHFHYIFGVEVSGPPATTYVNPGGTAVLSCFVTGHTAGTVTWSKIIGGSPAEYFQIGPGGVVTDDGDGLQGLINIEVYKVVVDPVNSTDYWANMTITTVVDDDQGQYSCWTGTFGDEADVGELLLAAKPEPATSVAVMDATDTTLTVTWVEGQDGGHTQIFTVEYKVDGPGKDAWMDSEKVDHPPVTLTGLQPLTPYEIRVRSNNTLGLVLSHPITANTTAVSTTTTVTTIPTTPTTATFTTTQTTASISTTSTTTTIPTTSTTTVTPTTPITTVNPTMPTTTVNPTTSTTTFNPTTSTTTANPTTPTTTVIRTTSTTTANPTTPTTISTTPTLSTAIANPTSTDTTITAGVVEVSGPTSTIYINLGDTAVLSCFVTDHTTGTVTWSKIIGGSPTEYFQIGPGGTVTCGAGLMALFDFVDYKVAVDPVDSTDYWANMTIATVDTDDPGQYSCWTGIYGDEADVGELVLAELPSRVVISDSSGDKVEVLEGVAQTLTCTAYDSKPQVSIQWTIDGTNVAEDSTNFTENSDGTYTSTSYMTYTYTHAVHHGKILNCVATNLAGTTQPTSVTLNVIMVPTTITNPDSTPITTANPTMPTTTANPTIPTTTVIHATSTTTAIPTTSTTTTIPTTSTTTANPTSPTTTTFPTTSTTEAITTTSITTVNPTTPATTVNPTTPTTTVNPTTSTTTANPTTSTTTANPTSPTTMTFPTTSTTEAITTTPTTTAIPTISTTTAIPTTPTTTAIPTTSTTTAIPTTSTTTVNPTTPTTTAIPTTSTTTAIPTTPTTTAIPTTSTTTDIPTTSTTTINPTTSTTTAIPTTSTTTINPTTPTTTAIPTTSTTTTNPTTPTTTAIPTTSTTTVNPTTPTTTDIPTISSTTAIPTTSTAAAIPTTSTTTTNPTISTTTDIPPTSTTPTASTTMAIPTTPATTTTGRPPINGKLGTLGLNTLYIIIGASFGGVLLLIIIILMSFCMYRRKNVKGSANLECHEMTSVENPHAFLYNEGSLLPAVKRACSGHLDQNPLVATFIQQNKAEGQNGQINQKTEKPSAKVQNTHINENGDAKVNQNGVKPNDQVQNSQSKNENKPSPVVEEALYAQVDKKKKNPSTNKVKAPPIPSTPQVPPSLENDALAPKKIYGDQPKGSSDPYEEISGENPDGQIPRKNPDEQRAKENHYEPVEVPDEKQNNQPQGLVYADLDFPQPAAATASSQPQPKAEETAYASIDFSGAT